MMLLMGAVQVFTTQLLADGGDSPSDVDTTTGHGPEWGEAAPIGLLVIVLMCVGVYFLVKSLNRNLKKVPDSFDAVPVSVGAPSDEASADSADATDPTESAAEPDRPEAGRNPPEAPSPPSAPQ